MATVCNFYPGQVLLPLSRPEGDAAARLQGLRQAGAHDGRVAGTVPVTAGRGLDQMRETALRDDLGVRAFDVFCPANFLDVLPWTASLDRKSTRLNSSHLVISY